jgi:hypothetical protein
MTLSFVYLPLFEAKRKRLRLSDEDVQAFEQLLLRDPETGAVIGGTGGVRKVRFAPPSWHTGKSGATRVIYAYVVVASTIYSDHDLRQE